MKIKEPFSKNRLLRKLKQEDRKIKLTNKLLGNIKNGGDKALIEVLLNKHPA